MGSRLAWYAGISTAAAGAVIISAFNQRANFYSACVYLAQSNLCLMIIINLILFLFASFMYGLQRLCYGPLRPIEVEQLYEKAWFAITETCLAMTIFREEVGAWFLAMFVALLTGKVWGWIGDGRVEILEQQPPANPRLFHIRLSISLAVSVIYDLWLMSYTINTVIQQARPNMMVMFLFEFAVLTTTSLSTACRYGISLVEARVIKRQTQARLMERRREVRREREAYFNQMEASAFATRHGSNVPMPPGPIPNENDIDEMDIEVPGWEAKGQWVLSLDLVTDFVKLGIYTAFFFILLTFYGLPIHIMRDLFVTARSFIKRLTAFLRYRRATHDMNKRYEDATVEDIQREDTCIICREEMRPWSVTNPPVAEGQQRPAIINERNRPKKLPCGHILHLGCLKSWLERQQVCPTCRRPVVETPQAANAAQDTNAQANNGDRAMRPGQPGAPPQAPNRPRGMRMLNLGPFRVGFGQGNLNELAGLQGPQAGPAGQANAAGGGAGAGPRVYGIELGFPNRAQPQPQIPEQTNQNGQSTSSLQIASQLQQIEQQIAQEIRGLHLAQQELQITQLLQAELTRLRNMQNNITDPLAANFSVPQHPLPSLVPPPPFPSRSTNATGMQTHRPRPNTHAIPSGSADLPPGVVIPEGWSLLPLQRVDSGASTTPGSVPFVPANTNAESSATPESVPSIPANINAESSELDTFRRAPASTLTVSRDDFAINNSNITQVPSPLVNFPSISPPANTPISSPLLNHNTGNTDQDSGDETGTNAIHTPSSVLADQSSSSTSTVTDTTDARNWSSSILNPNESNNGANEQRSSLVDLETPTNVEATDSTGESSSSQFRESTTGEESEVRRREKGKARAVLVEDGVDDEEGN